MNPLPDALPMTHNTLGMTDARFQKIKQALLERPVDPKGNTGWVRIAVDLYDEVVHLRAISSAPGRETLPEEVRQRILFARNDIEVGNGDADQRAIVFLAGPRAALPEQVEQERVDAAMARAREILDEADFYAIVDLVLTSFPPASATPSAVCASDCPKGCCACGKNPHALIDPKSGRCIRCGNRPLPPETGS